jgi:hypothetical protein
MLGYVMKHVWLLPLAYVLGGCSPPREQNPPEVYAAVTDQLLARFPILSLLGDVCVRGERRLEDERCYRFGEPRRWSGIIVHSDYFENSFYPGRAGLMANPPQNVRFAVVGAPLKRRCQSPLCRPWDDDLLTTRRKPMAFYVEFIGRRTAVQGTYGHMGIFGHKIIVDRLQAERPINLSNEVKTAKAN